MEPSLAKPPSFAGSFSSLNPPLTPWVSTHLANLGLTTLTPVQASVYPLALRSKDLLVEAVTGSGKTLAYLLPLLEHLIARENHPDKKKLKKNEVFAIVVVPTRELAVQIWEVLEGFWRELRASLGLDDDEQQEIDPESTMDGDEEDQDRAIRIQKTYPSPLLLVSGISSSTPPPPSPIIIATPGRLLSYLSSTSTTSTLPQSSYLRSRRSLSFASFEYLILDEADRLLAGDHLERMKSIWAVLPKMRRNWLFSATMCDLLIDDIGGGQTGGAAGKKAGLENAGLRNLVRVVVRVERKKRGALGGGDAAEVGGKRKRDEGDDGAKERRTPVSLQNTYLLCHQSEKTLQLIRLLLSETNEQNGNAKFIVYFSTCAGVDYFYRVLKSLPVLSNFHLSSLHGHLPPSIRSSTLTTFTNHASLPSSPSVLLCTDVAARGLDLPDVDVVIQYDPPGEVSGFSHRAGRAARMGRRGKGIVLIGKGREEGYIEFLALRKIPLREQAYVSESLEETNVTREFGNVEQAAVDLMEEIRDIVLKDRDLAEKAAKAYVSSIRAYQKHEASYIFRLKDLDLYGLGVAFGCLRLPKMPEVRVWRDRVRKGAERKTKAVERGDDESERVGEIDWKDRDVDWDAYAFASKTRESTRLEALKAAEENKAVTLIEKEKESAKRRLKAERGAAWSVQKERKERREERKEKKERKKDWKARVAKEEGGDAEGFSLMQQQKCKAPKKVVAEGSDDDEEYRQLKREDKSERAAKKARKNAEKGGGAMTGAGGMFDGLS